MNQHTTARAWRRGLVRAGVAAAAALLPAPAWAQNASGAARAPERLEPVAARAITRAALLDLRLSRAPDVDDYRIAGTLLDAALRLTPDDPELVRRRVEAAFNAADNEAYLDSTRRLLRLDPTDSVALLRLTAARIASLQTVEERLAAYDSILGPAGASIDPAVRSRLALDSALLLREIGDEAGHAARLAEALRLDGTNKEAASLLLRLEEETSGDPERRFTALSVLLLTDPVDANVLLEVGRFLLARGAREQGLRFYKMGDRMVRRAGGTSEVVEVELMLAEWLAQGPEVVLQRLNKTVSGQRYREKVEVEMREKYSVPGPMPTPQFLTPSVEAVRATAAFCADDTATLEASLNDFSSTISTRYRQITEPGGLPPDVRLEDLIAGMRPLTVELQTLRLWFNTQTDKIDADLQTYRDALPSPSTPVYRVYEAWRRLRAGDAAPALEIFQAADPAGPAGAGQVEALLALGRAAEAEAILRRLVTEKPTTLSGAWASERLKRMGLVNDEDRALADRLTAAAAALPGWLDRSVADPRLAVSLVASLADRRADVLDPTRLIIRVRNISPVPLSVGGDRTISSRFLLAPRYVAAAGELVAPPEPEVFDSPSRLRLNPGETMETLVWADPGLSGWLAWASAHSTMTSRWRVIQGFLSASMFFEPGPWSIELETSPQQRERLALAAESPDELAEAAASLRGPALARAMVASLSMMVGQRSAPRISTTQRENLSAALARVYPTLDPLERAAALAILPNAAVAPEMAAFDRAAEAETDPALQPLMIVTRLGDPASPRLAELEAAGGEPGRVAAWQRERLTAGRMTLASTGPLGTRRIEGPAPGAEPAR